MEDKLWEILNEYGIYTMEEFQKAYQEMEPLDLDWLMEEENV